MSKLSERACAIQKDKTTEALRKEVLARKKPRYRVPAGSRPVASVFDPRSMEADRG